MPRTSATRSNDHGILHGLTDDDHLQYFLLAGRSGGQTAYGGTGAGDDLTLYSTSNATKGTINLGDTAYVDEVNNRLGLGVANPAAPLEIIGSSWPVQKIVRTTSIVSGIASGYQLLTKTSGNMGDGFGGGLTFSIQDNSGGEKSIATFYTERDGADNSGAITLNTYNTGILYERIRINSSGNVRIGSTATISSRLTFDESTTAAGGILFGTDTNLYRSAANTLKTDDSMIIGSVPTLVVDNANGKIGVKCTPNFLMTLVSSSAITPEASAVGLSASNTLSVQGANAAYFMGRDTTNDIEFAFGSSSSGLAFLGSMTAHDLSIRTSNTERMLFDNSDSNIVIRDTWKLQWGSSGTSSPDTNLYRLAENLLKSDDTIQSAGRIEAINSTAKTGAYTVTALDENVLCDTSGGAFTVTLPASPEIGRVYNVILETAGSNLTIAGNGNNINGSASLVLTVAYQSATLIYNGTQWNIK